MKKYRVTNMGNGTITLMGARRVEIPGGVVDMELNLPDETAKATVSRLTQRYPLLKIVDGNAKPEKAPEAAPVEKAPEAAPVEEAKDDSKTSKKK